MLRHSLFSNQLCGFRRRQRTSGLSTPSTLFRKLKQPVVVSEVTRLKFWSWHKLLLLLKRMVEREAAIGLVAQKPKLWLSPQTSALQQACSRSPSLSCGQRKNLSDTKSLFSCNIWGERRGSWAVNRGRIYNSENHVFVELSPSLWATPRCSRGHTHACVWADAQTAREPQEGDGTASCALGHMAQLHPLRTGGWPQDSKAKVGLAKPVREAVTHSIPALATAVVPLHRPQTPSPEPTCTFGKESTKATIVFSYNPKGICKNIYI